MTPLQVVTGHSVLGTQKARNIQLQNEGLGLLCFESSKHLSPETPWGL